MEFVKMSNVKEFLRQNKMRTSTGVHDALNAKIGELLKEASKRASINGRQTVMGQDI